MNKQIKLLPCPVCGRKPIIRDNNGDFYIAECNQIDAVTRLLDGKELDFGFSEHRFTTRKETSFEKIQRAWNALVTLINAEKEK